MLGITTQSRDSTLVVSGATVDIADEEQERRRYRVGTAVYSCGRINGPIPVRAWFFVDAPMSVYVCTMSFI
jgi:hypothetical protein